MTREKAGVDLRREWIETDVTLRAPEQYAVFAPDIVAVPMQQHVGAPCRPVVEKGERVCLGQLVGDSYAAMSAPVHASVSGRVVDIAEYPQARGGKALCVVIENDGAGTAAEPLAEAGGGPTPAQVRRIVRKAGVVGMGGAAFPTHIKLDVKDKRVDTLLLNGAECEPGLFADNALMAQHADGILAGAVTAQKAVGAGRILVGIEEDKPAAIHAMRKAAQKSRGAVNVAALPKLYPQGGEKQLIRALTGRQVPEGGLPAEAGVVVLNVGTALAVHAAVQGGAPLTHRVCTVTGDVAAPQNVRFPIGTLAGDLLRFCGGFSGALSKVIVGGPMMGVTIETLQVPLIKASNGLVAVAGTHDFAFRESPCIRCNRCVEVCPMALVPWKLDRYWRKSNMAGCEAFHAQSCINCGCCTYICPARRALAENITEAKSALQKREKEAQDG